MTEREWGTQLPNGKVCAWNDEHDARKAALVSQTFPDGAHPLVFREVGPWTKEPDKIKASQ